MTAAYDKDEAERLIAECREDDARLTSAPWRYDRDGYIESMDRAINHTGSETEVLVLGARMAEDDGEGVARTRNNLRPLADQLEAAGREIEMGREELAKLQREVMEWAGLRALQDYTAGMLKAAIEALRAARSQLLDIRNTTMVPMAIANVVAGITEALEAAPVVTSRDAAAKGEALDAIRQALGASDTETTVQAAERLLAEVTRLDGERMEAGFLLGSAQQRIAELERKVKYLEYFDVTDEAIDFMCRTLEERTTGTAAESAADDAVMNIRQLQRQLARARAERNPALVLPPVSEEAQVVVDRIVAEGRPRATAKQGLAERRAAHGMAPLSADERRNNADDAIGRVAELEREPAEARDLLAILRAIWPVHRALHHWFSTRANSFNNIVPVNLRGALNTATAALTPELLAAARQCGLDTP